MHCSVTWRGIVTGVLPPTHPRPSTGNVHLPLPLALCMSLTEPRPLCLGKAASKVHVGNGGLGYGRRRESKPEPWALRACVPGCCADGTGGVRWIEAVRLRTSWRLESFSRMSSAHLQLAAARDTGERCDDQLARASTSLLPVMLVAAMQLSPAPPVVFSGLSIGNDTW